MRGIGIVIAVLIGSQPATAGEWTRFEVSSTSSGQNGTAAKIAGVVDDSHGTRPARLVVSCVNDSPRVLRGVLRGGDNGRTNAIRRRSFPYYTSPPGRSEPGRWKGAGIPFVRSFLDAGVLKMNFTRHFGGPIHATFPVHGAREALRDVGRQCGWMPKDEH